jgi:hypothetical protein
MVVPASRKTAPEGGTMAAATAAILPFAVLSRRERSSIEAEWEL